MRKDRKATERFEALCVPNAHSVRTSGRFRIKMSKASLLSAVWTAR